MKSCFLILALVSAVGCTAQKSIEPVVGSKEIMYRFKVVAKDTAATYTNIQSVIL